MWRKIWTVLMAVCVWQGSGRSQAIADQGSDLSGLLLRFSQQAGEHPTAESFYPQAQESLWEVYPHGDSLKPALIDYVKGSADGPRLCFAGLALIAFHDAATVRPMLERAMDTHTSPGTRWCFLNAAPYILGMGDVMYLGEGQIDEDSNQLFHALMKDADAAAKSGIGHTHAQRLRELMVDAPEATKKDPDYPLALWHESAYLLGTLDLRDERLLERGLTSPYRTVFQNTIEALGYAVNRDFLRELVKKQMDEVTPEMERATGKSADLWWQGYLRDHPDGDWHAAVMAGFLDAGYKIEKDYRSAQSQRELLRALDDGDPHIRYNACRLLNEIYQTHFDLDVAFLAGKYALSFLDPMPKQAANEARLKKYWQKRLGQ